jgi:hypothetical protein
MAVKSDGSPSFPYEIMKAEHDVKHKKMVAERFLSLLTPEYLNFYIYRKVLKCALNHRKLIKAWKNYFLSVLKMRSKETHHSVKFFLI